MRRLKSIVGWAFVLLCAAVAAVPLYGQVTGRYRLLPVLSGSMAPEMVRGDLAWVEPKPLAELKVGDVLVFNSPARGSTPSRRTIHRVIEFVDPARIREDEVERGTVYVRTKGDANLEPDPWIAAISTSPVWVRTGVVGDLGRPLLATEDKRVRVLGPMAGAALMAVWGAGTLLRKSPDEGSHEPEPAAAPESPTPRPSARRPGRLRAGLVGAAATATGVAGVSAAVTAALTGQSTSVNTVEAGGVSLSRGTSTLSVVVSDLLPGERVDRVFDLTNDGTVGLGSLTLEVSGDNGTLLDPSTGLQLEVTRCPQAWQVVSTPATQSTARCASTPTSVVADRPLVGRTPLDPSVLDVDDPGGVDHLRVTVRLSDTAPPALAGQRSTVTLAFLGAQRNPTIR